MNKKEVLTLICLGVIIIAISINTVNAQTYFWGNRMRPFGGFMMGPYWYPEDQSNQPYWSPNSYYCPPWWNYNQTQQGQLPIPETTTPETPVPEEPYYPPSTPRYPPRGYGRGCCGSWTG
ncbi:MAG: hypothetical protein DRP00_05435 [Candidatus Aenigmatarchaeota archaeon]|nr:MAG: hypothetical protein DRP00_05435 [Candidatus Aenigmarchaeota archaeon]